MSPKHNTVLSLIAATIFADQRVLDSEIQTFAKATSKLRMFKNAKPRLSEDHIFAWYETNQDVIFKKVKAPYFKTWFYDLLEELSNVEEQDSIIEIMQKISRADGSIHISERALFTLAKRYWGLT